MCLGQANHKDKNSSLINRFYKFAANEGKISVFNKDISRDYIYVNDLCAVLIDTMLDKEINGIFNLGSGKSWKHEEIANLVIRTINELKEVINPVTALEKINMPDDLINKFQYFTIAEELPVNVIKRVCNTESRMVEYIKFMIKEDEVEN
jgi:ADP-L-glycero-D-manno-heptose 6-epimerase